MPSFLEHLEMLERWRRFPGRERLEPGEGRVALTFDDGPDPDSTPAVLDALAAAGAKATFFLVGEQLERHPELGRAVVDHGHEAALHGFHHVNHDALGDDAGDDLARGLEALESVCGTRPQLYRPPYGRFSDASHAACGELRLEPVLWLAWGSDWEPVPADRIADLASRDLTDGAIVLLHDSARYAYRRSAAATAEALPAIAQAARQAGLELVSVSGS